MVGEGDGVGLGNCGGFALLASIGFCGSDLGLRGDRVLFLLVATLEKLFRVVVASCSVLRSFMFG